MYFNPKNRKIWANAMREKILGRLHCSYTVIRTSTADLHQFREAAHVAVVRPTPPDGGEPSL